MTNYLEKEIETFLDEAAPEEGTKGESDLLMDLKGGDEE